MSGFEEGREGKLAKSLGSLSIDQVHLELELDQVPHMLKGVSNDPTNVLSAKCKK